MSVHPVVTDCSVLIKWEMSDEEHTDAALEMLQDWQSGSLIVQAPDLLHSEIGSAFLRALRRGRVSETEALASIRGLLAFPFVIHPSSLLVEPAFEIARRLDQRIYDCFYVALAERESCEFWTGDERLFNALAHHHACLRFIGNYIRRR